MPFSRSLHILYRGHWVALFMVAMAMFAGLFWNHYNLIFYPALLDYNEGAMPVITQTILSGGSPYSLESQPARISVYPPLYNYIVAPFSLYFGNTLETHRLVAGIFILASVILFFTVSRRAGLSIACGMASAAMFYAGLLYYSTPIASPNSVGLFLFLVSVVAPWYGNFSNRSLVCALIAGVLAFYGKQYFVACLGYVSLYLFLFVSKGRAILYGFYSVLAFVVSLYVVQSSFPYFIDDTVFAVKQATSIIDSTETMVNQLITFAETYMGLLLLLLVAFARIAHQKLTGEKAEQEQPVVRACSLKLRDFRQPLLTCSLDYFWFCFICSLGIVVFVIGRNPGNNMTYLFQLMAPFLLIAIYSTTARLSHAGSYLKWLTVPFILYSLHAGYTLLPNDFTVDKKGWNRLGKVLEGKKQAYASPIALPFLMESGSDIFNNGHTVYFFFSRSKPMFMEKTRAEETSVALWNKHVSRIHENIMEKKFDLIILDPWTRLPEVISGNTPEFTAHQLLKQHYKVSEKFRVSLAKRPGGGNYAVKIWRPRPE